MSITSGIYNISAPSGVMAAGLGSAAPIYSFRWTSPSLQCSIRRVRISAGDTSTAFAAGTFIFNMFVARKFTASDTGGTAIVPVGNDGKLRTAYPTSQIGDLRISSTATLTAGTRTLDAQAIGSLVSSDPATAGNDILAPIALFTPWTTEERLLLMQNEGFVIQATVPATGTWSFAIETAWEEGTGF